MRTLSAELTSAQQASSYTPFIKLILTRKDGATSDTYATDDVQNRIVRVRFAEGMYGGVLFDTALPSGRSIGIAAQIILDNSDNEFTSKDLRGYRVQIQYGFVDYWDGSATVTIVGTKFSEGEPFIVLNQRDATVPGASVIELWCFSMWEMLELSPVRGDEDGFGVFTGTGHNIRQLLLAALTKPSTQVWMFDDSASVFTDRTTVSEPLDNSAGGWTWLVDASDILYISTPGTTDSELNEFDRITIWANLQGVGTWTAAYEYFNGAAWTALSNVTDNTDIGRDVHGNGISPVPRVILFTHPSDWAATSINGVSRRYIRIRIATSTTVTTAPEITRIGVSKSIGMQTDDLDAFDTILKPEYQGTIDTSWRDVFRNILSMTRYAPVMTKDFMRINIFDDTPGSTDYSYNDQAGHTFFSSQREKVVVVPNFITAVKFDNDTSLTQITGTAAEDAASQADIGVVAEVIVDNSISQASDATTRAARRLSRYQHEAFQGEIVAPVNIGQEPWDWIGVTDQKLGATYTGRVGRIIREYDWYTGSFRMEISLGIMRSAPTSGLVQALIGAGVMSQIRESTNLLLRARALVESSEPSVLPELQDLFAQGVQFDTPESERFRLQQEGVPSRVFNPLHGLRALSEPINPIRVQTRQPRIGDIPNIPLATGDVPVGLPHWYGLTPMTGNYQQVKQRTQSNSRGLTENEPRLRTIFLPDFIGGGYKPVQIFNDGAGNLIIEGESGTGTDIDGIKTTRAIRFQETGGGDNFTGIVAPASLTGDVTLVLPDGDGSSGEHLETDGSGTLSWGSGSGAGDFQRFTTAGSATWTKPSGVNFVVVEGIGGGGGGGGGRGRPSGETRPGGAGGGGGALVTKIFPAASLGATEDLFVGGGGAGGTGGTNGNGTDAIQGGTSEFGTNGAWLVSPGGGSGDGGIGTGAGGGAGSGTGKSKGAPGIPTGQGGVSPRMEDASGLYDAAGGVGGGGGAEGVDGGNAEYGGGGGGGSSIAVGNNGGGSLQAAGGGGGGGSLNAANVEFAGGVGGEAFAYSTGGGGSAGAVGGGIGGNGGSLQSERGGDGAGGGGSNASGNGGNGGTPGTPGGGGGGGGGGTNTGGNGSAGARGEIRVYSF